MPVAEPDYTKGSKRQVAELKFLIHDLRIEKTINNIIHFHVTLNTDLEIYDIEQAHVFHSDDLAELKVKAAKLRRAWRDYSNAVRNFSPDKIILATGYEYIETIQEMSELILNPLWGRFDRVISFLPEDSRSVQARNHYRNDLRWICGVYYRIDYFLQELDSPDLREEFDVGYDVIDYTNTVIYGYIVERSHSRVEIQVDRRGNTVISANRPRFRRMYFNLVMNAVDAFVGRPVGMIRVSVHAEDEQAVLQVTDNGSGMYPDKIQYLLSDRETLDGELHSLGFLFVRQTVAKMGGTLDIDSEIGKGTTITIRLPILVGREPPPRHKSRCQRYAVMPFEDDTGRGPTIVVTEDEETSAPAEAETPSPPPARTAPIGPIPFEPLPSRKKRASGVAAKPVRVAEPEIERDFDESDHQANTGRILYLDYQLSKEEAESPGSLFAISMNYDLSVDMLVHRRYEAGWNLNHEDLNPMLYDAVIRGRLERGDDRAPQLILKEPHGLGPYFDLKEIHDDRSKERYVDMIHDEYVLIARKLLATGLPSHIPVHLTGADKYFPGFEKTLGAEPFALDALAGVKLTTE